jgi:hypothetical protein
LNPTSSGANFYGQVCHYQIANEGSARWGYYIRTSIYRKWEQMELAAHFFHLFYVMAIQVVPVEKPVEIQRGFTSVISSVSASVTSIFLYFLCPFPSSLSQGSELSYTFASYIKQFHT